MMMERLDASTPRKKTLKDGTEKTFWTRIGSIWVKDDGSVSVELDALPIPDKDGRVVIKGFKPREGNSQPDTQNQRTNGNGSFQDMSDDLPF